MLVENLGIIIKDYSFKKNLKSIIPSSNYLTHNLYSYPAKFIAHVPFYVISKYLSKDDCIILDPFAGSSSTAIEALHLKQNCICLDINPLTDFLTRVKTQKINFILDNYTFGKSKSTITPNKRKNEKTKDKIIDLSKFMRGMIECEDYFEPEWNNIDHWYSSEFKIIISKVWGYIYSLEGHYPEEFLNLTKLTALYLSRYFSSAARDIPKLFRSKRRIIEINALKKKIEEKPIIPYEIFEKKMLEYYKHMKKYTDILDKEGISPEFENSFKLSVIENKKSEVRKVISLGNTDIMEYNFSDDSAFVDLIVTSPPYIYAQEYIRSTKLDLYWLNLANDKKIRELTKKELGAKKSYESSFIKTKLDKFDTFNKLIEILEEKEKKKYKKVGKYSLLVLNYFFDMYTIIKKLTRTLKKDGIFALFIGNPTIIGHQVKCYEIFIEFFLEIGLEIVEIGFDPIISPRLLKGRQNESPNGMKKEWLIIGNKK